MSKDFPEEVLVIGELVTWTNKSGTITAGGTAQDAAAANVNRKGFLIQNVSTADMWFNVGTTAVADQPSVLLRSGAMYESSAHACPAGKISVIGATTGQAFTCKEW